MCIVNRVWISIVLYYRSGNKTAIGADQTVIVTQAEETFNKVIINTAL